MKIILVLAMHGAPPNDFPRNELAELMGLHNRLERASSTEQALVQSRYSELESRVRTWPRTAKNDPFYAGSTALAEQLEAASGLPVMLGFNEFCAPSLDEALDRAASNAERILVITPMMTRGGEHSEQDIPASIQRTQERHPKVRIQYVWPFELSAVARFLAEQLKGYQ
jgi:sirohydrochlorin cobaltochelatase